MNANELIQLFGVLYFIMGLSFLFNKKYYSGAFKDLIKSTSYMLIAWMVAFVIGFIIILSFNEFTLSKEWLVAVFWVLSLLKWVNILLFPKSFSKFAKKFTKTKHFDLIWMFVTVLGLLLMYLGFFS